MGILILGIACIYLLISSVIVLSAIRYARRNGLSAKRWGWGAALVMWLIPFWDWLPTVAVHQYYCTTEAGFWVYKTLDQWKAENPGVIEKLMSYDKNTKGGSINWPSQYESYSNGHRTTYHINERFNRIIERQDMSRILRIVRKEETLIDTRKNEVMARYVGFGSGYSEIGHYDPSDARKFWLRSSHCRSGKEHEAKSWKFSLQFKGAKK
jgi:hypothetical protein